MQLEEVELYISNNQLTYPDVNSISLYMCLINGTYLVGRFESTASGLLFHGPCDTVIVYEAPGNNNSGWGKIYRIIEDDYELAYRTYEQQKQKWKSSTKKEIRTSDGQLVLSYRSKQ